MGSEAGVGEPATEVVFVEAGEGDHEGLGWAGFGPAEEVVAVTEVAEDVEDIAGGVVVPAFHHLRVPDGDAGGAFQQEGGGFCAKLFRFAGLP